MNQGIPSRLRPLLRRTIIVSAAVGFAAVVIALGWCWLGFDPTPLGAYPAVTHIVDRNGNSLRVVLGDEDRYGDPISLSDSGDWAAKALIAAEDKRFYGHHGVDLQAVLRATFRNVLHRHVVSGASTLSTQVVKMTHPRRRSMRTKFIEAVHAAKMETRCSKDEILEQYLNRAPMGGNIHGVEAGARKYFGKAAADLSIGEAALLMGLPQSPSRYRPDRHLPRAMKRRQYVLRRMASVGFITEAQRRDAERHVPRISEGRNPFSAPHFCDFVMQEHGDEILPTRPGPGGGLRTTLDPECQRVVESAAVDAYRHLLSRSIDGVAIVVLEVATGSIRALVGSPDYANPTSGQVNCAALPRSPGSALKPFAYAMAIDQGKCTADTLVYDVPTKLRGYVPENFERRFRGPVSVREALVQSLNIPALQIVQEVGLEPFAALLRAAGITTLTRHTDSYGISMVLGTTEVTLIDLVNAYAVLARQGRPLPYQVRAQDAKRTSEPISDDPSLIQAGLISPAAAYIIADILGGDERSLAGVGHMADARGPRVAWKTGTSSGYLDAWTIAYNPEYVVGVWVGDPAGRARGRLVGIEDAAPVALRVFRSLYPDGEGPWFERPRSVVNRDVCAVTGQPPSLHCPRRVTGLAVRGISDPTLCRVHRSPETEIWPPNVASFLSAQQVLDPPKLRLRIVAPVDGARFSRSPNLPSSVQELELRAQGSGADVFWFLDQQLIARASSDEAHRWPLTPGQHRITCTDASGLSDSVTISVQ